MDTIKAIVDMLSDPDITDERRRILFDSLDRANKEFESNKVDDDSDAEPSDAEPSDAESSDDIMVETLKENEEAEMRFYKKKREFIIDALFRVLERDDFDDEKTEYKDKLETMIGEKLEENGRSDEIPDVKYVFGDRNILLRNMNESCHKGIHTNIRFDTKGKPAYHHFIIGRTDYEILPLRVINYICKNTPPIVILRNDPAFYYAFQSKLDQHASRKIMCKHCKQDVRRDYMYKHLRKQHPKESKTKNGKWLPCNYYKL